MLEFGQNQNTLEFDSDLSEAVAFANTVFGSGLGCGDLARPEGVGSKKATPNGRTRRGAKAALIEPTKPAVWALDRPKSQPIARKSLRAR